MPRHLSLVDARALLHTRDDLVGLGWSSRDITRAVNAGELRRMQRNRYVPQEIWDDLWPESRHRLEVEAAVGEMREGQGVLSYESGGVVWDLPLHRHVPAAVHFTLPAAPHASSRAGLLRHREPLPGEDVTLVHSVAVTTLERTTFDVIRSVGLATAVAFADAALRVEAMIGREYVHARALAWRERMLDRVALARGVRGVRQAGWVIRFADGRAELPGESVTRLRLNQLGFGRVELQVPVRAAEGGFYRVDLDLEDAGAFLEFDGKSKYLDEALRRGKTVAEVLLEEKRREDWIRGVTQRRFVRVEDAHIQSADALRSRLAAFGIRPPA